MMCKHRRAAFTLVELLVSIGVIALLLTLVLPAMSHVRRNSKRLKSLTNIRTLGTVMDAYCNANKEAYPQIDEDRMYTTASGSTFGGPFWDVHYTWVGVVADFMPREHYHEIIKCPDALSSERYLPYTSYWYSWTFVVRAEWWKDTPDPAALRSGSRVADVLFPSRKCVLWDEDAGYYKSANKRIGNDIAVDVPVCFADGSARILKPSDATTPMPNSSAPGNPIENTRRLLCTRDGVRGVDY